MPMTRSAPGAELDADNDDISGSSVKRRKTRKGTRSCWACKRRKEKCVFDQSIIPAHDAVCMGCQRRGTRCVSQDSPDDLTSPPDGARQMADRLVRVENLVQNLLHQMADDDDDDVPAASAHRNGGNTILTPAPTESGHPSTETIPNTPIPAPIALDRPVASSGAPHDRLQRKGGHSFASLSHTLYNYLPTPKDGEIIINASYRSFYIWVDITRPDAQDHPVLIARYMLQLAHLLQQLHLKFDDPSFDDLKGLSEPPRGLMERLSEIAVSQLSTQDRLVVGSIEGLECIMLESTFYANDGRLRLSWSSCRRALHLAQLMGLHEAAKQQSRHQFLDPKSVAEPSALWVRIIHRDRSLSLLLGLSPGSTHKTVVNDDLLAQDTPLGRLERFHCDIMLSLLERKEKARSRDLALAHSLDKELQQAARVLPSKWWLTPSFPTPEKHDEGTFWGIKRLVLQMSHYNILNQIHLPFMLLRRGSSDPAYEYSKTACVNASREILSRFIVLQHLNSIAFCCRTPDFLALMAAMTLILAHLQNHSRADQTSNPMAHQYLSDRGMIEQTQESMEELSRRSGELLSAESANLLRRLLVIEAEAADGCKERAQGVDVLQPQSEEGNDGDGVVRVTIPYFGVVQIAREGSISKETPEQQSSGTRNSWQAGRLATTGIAVATLMADALPPVPLSPSAMRFGQFSDPMSTDPSLPLDTMDYPMQFDDRVPNNLGLAAGGEEWAFQGIDMAFFDSLLSGDTGDELFR
ncbi:hypothetical protein PG988_003477 [Apiospora saccharicola]